MSQNSQTSLEHFNQSISYVFCKSCHSELESKCFCAHRHLVSALVPTLVLINVTEAVKNHEPKQPNKPQALQPINFIRTLQVLSLRIGEQVFLCSSTLVSALVPTLVLINVTEAVKNHEPKQPNKPQALQPINFIRILQALSLRIGEQVFLCSSTLVSALVPTLVLINVTEAVKSHEPKQPNKPQALQPIDFIVFCKSCHSELESKCFCAHRHLSQLWCQHLSSSM